MSQISTYIECKKKAHLAYEMGLEPKPNEESAMSKGTAFHQYAEFQTTTHWPHLPQVACPDVTQETADLWSHWWANKGEAKHETKKRVLGVEAPLYTPIEINTGIPGQRVYLRTTFDEIYLDKEGWIVGLDYKTFKVASTWDVDLDFQGRIYIAALQHLFPTYRTRFEYERIRQSAPGTPRGNSQFLRMEEGEWWQYNKAGDKRKRAELWTPDECYQTTTLVVAKDELEVLWNETKFNIMELIVRRRAAETMLGAWGRTSSHSSCQYCNFQALCKADLFGQLDEQTIEALANHREPLEIPEELKIVE